MECGQIHSRVFGNREPLELWRLGLVVDVFVIGEILPARDILVKRTRNTI